MLFDYTEGKAFAMLDSISLANFTHAWALSKQALEEKGKAAAKAVLLEQLPDRGAREEIKWLRTWLIRALDKGLAERVHPVGVTRGDIVEYLPVSALVPNATSWEQLREQHQDRLNIEGTPKDFKRWLELEQQGDFSISALRRACLSMDHIPSDLTNVLNEIERIVELGV